MNAVAWFAKPGSANVQLGKVMTKIKLMMSWDIISNLRFVGLIAFSGLLFGCGHQRGTSSSGETLHVDEGITIEGTVGYLERILPPPDSLLRVTLEESSRDGSKAVIAWSEWSPLEKLSFPLTYKINVSGDAIQSGKDYAISGEIISAIGSQIWRSEDHLIEGHNVGAERIGFLRLRRVSAENALIDISKFTGVNWRVEDINGLGVVDNSQTTLTFGPSQSISGNAGCNAYRTDYELQDGKLRVGPIRITRRACVPALADQEQAFLRVLEDAVFLNIDSDGALVLKTNDSRSIRASN